MNDKDIFSLYFKKNSVVYDIGANVGETVKIFCGIGAKHVYAFEPSPNNLPDLKKACEGLPATVLPIALHNRRYRCQTQFKDCRTDYTDANGKLQNTLQPIEYYTLDEAIADYSLPDPDFIKVDIEGMESLVLSTFDSLWKRSRPIIFCEIHAKPRALDSQDYLDNPHYRYVEQGGFDFNLLKGLGYTIEDPPSIIFPQDSDWNFPEGTHRMYVLNHKG